MKILVSVSAIFDIGGISTSILNFTNEVSKIHELTLVVSSGYVSPNITLPEGVKVIKGPEKIGDCFVSRELLKGQSLFRKLLRNYRRFVRRKKGMQYIIDSALKNYHINGIYDVAISFANNIYSSSGILTVGGDYDLVQNCVDAEVKIAWMHNDLNKEGYSTEICRKVFKNFNSIVNVSFDNKASLDRMIPEYENKSFVVYNMYNIEDIIKKSNSYIAFNNDGKIHITTVARLYNKQKKLNRIVEVCKQLVNDGLNNFIWKIVGEGEDREELQSKINEYNLGEFVFLEGLKHNPYPYMAQADAFVLSSLYEGLPMTIKEAEILGTPILTTAFGSAYEAVFDKCQGEVCENSEEGLYQMMHDIFLHPEKLVSYRKYLRENPVDNNLALHQLSIVINNRDL